MVLGLCRVLLRDSFEAEDAAQQTFVNAHRALHNGTTVRDEAAWLAAIARNECRARIVARMREPLALSYDELVDAAGTLDAEEPSEVSDEVRHALAELPERQREAVVLRDVYGLRYGEVGAALGLSRPAVESLLFRARRRLRVRLRPVAGALIVPLALRDSLAQALPGFAGGGAAVAGAAGATGVIAKLGAAPLAAKLAAGAVAVGAGAGSVAVVQETAAPRPRVSPPAASTERAPGGDSTTREDDGGRKGPRDSGDHRGPSDASGSSRADRSGPGGGTSEPRGEPEREGESSGPGSPSRADSSGPGSPGSSSSSGSDSGSSHSGSSSSGPSSSGSSDPASSGSGSSDPASSGSGSSDPASSGSGSSGSG